LNIYDVGGRLVRQLAGAAFASGLHTIKWDGTDMHGKRVSSGLFIYKLTSGGFSSMKIMRFVK
jgi:flagellar hook assembly protein FlgD